jgi:hypothetical protein
MALVLGFLSSSVLSSARSKDTLFFFKDMLLADEKIRELAGEIVVPYWEHPYWEYPSAVRSASGGGPAGIVPGGTALEIPWHNGRKENLLRIQLDSEGRLSMNAIQDGDSPVLAYTAPASLAVNAVNLLYNSNSVPVGVKVSYDYRGKYCYTIAIFGSMPPGKVRHD